MTWQPRTRRSELALYDLPVRRSRCPRPQAKCALAAAVVALSALAVSSEARAAPTYSAQTPFFRNPATVYGTATWATAYLFPALFLPFSYSPSGSTWLLIPVAGPWLALNARSPTAAPIDGLERFFLITDGVVQGVGFAMLLAGQFLPVGQSDATSSRLPNRPRIVPRIGAAPSFVGVAVDGVL